MNFLHFKFTPPFFLGLLFVFFLGCRTNPLPDLNQLEGYWEIDFITQQGETFKPQSLAPLYDHYSLSDNQGVFNKVASLIDGNFETSLDQIYFVVEQKDQSYIIFFKTRWDQWSKKIDHLDTQKLILEHDNRKFHYKRPNLTHYE
ncbi:MAG: hypothetical protein VW080_08120 [Flavobacteriaceae bacterium]